MNMAACMEPLDLTSVLTAAVCVPQDFGLTIDIESLIKLYGADGSDDIDYGKYCRSSGLRRMGEK